ncbi:hypothetical protein BG74_08805 [Sodalis-like endosymbiont of Proechinophthirus fluctus]|nr:hypothetical protein BG74_08805 [Sodalis-like endosymbiont of Proechinophthirus fluctus]
MAINFIIQRAILTLVFYTLMAFGRRFEIAAGKLLRLLQYVDNERCAFLFRYKIKYIFKINYI